MGVPRSSAADRQASLAAIERRRWLLQMLALGAVGCTRRDDRGSSRNTTATIAYEERALQPDYDEPDKRLVFLPLVVENERGDLEGRLAERWEHSADYHEWTYYLRPGLRWHNGVPVTAHDVKFSLDLLAHPDVLSFGPRAFESVRVHDELTVTVRTGRLITPYSYNTWPICYPKHRLERLDPKKIDEWEFWTHPLGNGPYRFVRYVPQTMIEYEANADYYRGKPKIEHVRLKFVGQSSLTELLSGNVDSAHVDLSQVAALAGNPHFRVYYSVQGTNVVTLWWRHSHVLFRDRRVRLALTLAINRTELLRVLRIPETIPIVDGPFSRGQFRRQELAPALAFDPARARTLLDAAGWRVRAGDGLREREGRPFQFTAIIRENFGGAQATAVYVQDQLRRVGIGMDIQFLEQASLHRQVLSGRFEAAFTTFGPSPLSLFGNRSWVGYSSPAASELIERLAATLDPDARDAIYRDLTALCREDMPVTFLYPVVSTTVAHQRLQGLSSPWRTNPVVHMEDLWLDDRA
ncbi:MAG: ABC transporter substrate-binding protein [Vicinamibacterales bacterium]